MRKGMESDAINLFSEMKYAGAGTIEFLVKGEDYYFMEVNARIQVEHPVTEMLTGVDIVKEQILSCSGEGLSIRQEDIAPRGHALECRVNALSSGKVGEFRPPLGPFVRTDSFLYDGCAVPPYYDSLVAKVIVSAEGREACLKRMERALAETVIAGIPTNIESQLKIIGSAKFRSGNFGTGIYCQIFKEGPNGKA
jgi:acetyl-CoA carboxylase biotin carboxylase subunit